MKNLKKILSLMLALCIVISLLTVPVHAAYCCELSVDSIVQEAGKVVVNFTTNSTEDNRNIRIDVGRLFEKDGSLRSSQVAYEESVVSSGSQNNSVEFDSSLFISGEKYRVTVRYDRDCSQYNCIWGASKDFVCESGMPVYEIGSTYSEDITIGMTPVALKVTASQSGIYDLFVDCEDDWCLQIECDGTIGDFGTLMYLKENESMYYQVMVSDYAWDVIESCQAKFKADLVDIETINPITTTPADGDTVYTLKDVTDVVWINIPVSGQYEIFTECGNGGEALLMNEDGEEVVSQYFNQEGKHILNAGTYYYFASPWSIPSDSYTTTIKYYEIETMQFGDEISSDSYDDKYLNFKLDKMAAVWAENKSGSLNMRAASGDNNWYIADYVQVLPAGEYRLTYSGNGSVVINKTDIPTVIIGDEISAYEYQGSSYVILQAPETGEYEFYTSENGASIDGEWLSSGYYYMTMQAGETKSVEYYHDYGTISVKKYVPEYTQVNIGEKTDLNVETGKKMGFSFTVDSDDLYTISLDDAYNSNAYFETIKIYKDNNVLYEGKDVYFEDLELKLEKDETVYIEIFNTNSSSIKITKPTKISGNTVVDFSNSFSNYAKEKFIYTPSQAGYYDFSVRNLSQGYAYVEVLVNGERIGEISYDSGNSVDSIIYASPEEPLFIELTKGSNQTANGGLVFNKITTESIENTTDFEITDNSYYSFTLPETGVYKITGKAFYNTSSWREEGVYPYFFTPIIKNHKETSFSYDAQEGDVPVYFFGNKGDEVLFKEEVTSPYYPFEYPITGSIAKVDTEEIQLGSLVSSSEDCKFYSINIKKDGTYKFEDFSDELFDPNVGTWGTYYGRGYTMFGVDSEWYSITGTATGEIIDGIFDLKAGTYYIAAATYDQDLEDEHIPEARFKISKVDSDTPDDEALEINGTKSESGVSYAISGNIPEDATLYAVLYDGERLKEIKVVESPVSEGTVTFDNSVGSYDCKLFLWDVNMKPLCNNVICD